MVKYNMKIVREHINFEIPFSADDFKRKLKVGKIAQIEKWFNDLDISSEEYTIDKDFNINVKENLFLSGTNITSLPYNLSVG